MQQHIHALELKSVNVLFSGDQEIGEYVIEQLQEGFKDTYNVAGVLTRSCSAREIRRSAQNRNVDIFILILNNLTFSPPSLSPENRIEKALRFLTFT